MKSDFTEYSPLISENVDELWIVIVSPFQILSMAHDYEEHPTPKDETEPDYKLIYKYLSTLFQADELPEPLPSLGERRERVIVSVSLGRYI